MHKIIFLVGITTLILAGCTNTTSSKKEIGLSTKQDFVSDTENKNESQLDNIELNKTNSNSKLNEIYGEVKAKYIDISAKVISKDNVNEFNNNFNIELPKNVLSGESTAILLVLNNHRDNLANFDYKNISSLNGMNASEWILLSTAMGGHHASGLLLFDKQENPKKLIIADLPVGNVTISFDNSEL